MKRFFAAATVLLFVCPTGSAEELRGKIIGTSGPEAEIRLESTKLPSVGDAVTIYFKLPGVDDEVLVGTGKVASITDGLVKATIDNLKGTLQKEQLVRITSENPKPKASGATVAPATTAPASTATSQQASPTPAAQGATPAPRGPSLFTHTFETASPITTPLYGPTAMTSRNVNGEGELTGRAPGILPAFFGKLLLDDFILECDVGAEQVPSGSSYGFIFRSADVKNGKVSAHYSLVLDPNRKIVILYCWNHGKWLLNEQPISEGTLSPGQKQRIALEVRGSQFVVFIDGKFAAKFSDPNLTRGRIGLCLNSAGADPWSAHFDNFRIFLFPKESPVDTPPPNYVPKLGTAASYNCDDGSGNTLTDNSNNVRPMKLFGGLSFATGKQGKALDFKDSAKLYARREKDDPIFNFADRDFTIELHANFRAFAHEQVLLEKFSAKAGPGWTLTLLERTKLHFYAQGAGSFTAGVNLKPSQWYRFTVARRGSRLQMSVDDAVVVDEQISGSVVPSANPLLLGRRNEQDGRGFPVNGLIDDIRIDVVPPKRE